MSTCQRCGHSVGAHARELPHPCTACFECPAWQDAAEVTLQALLRIEAKLDRLQRTLDGDKKPRPRIPSVRLRKGLTDA